MERCGECGQRGDHEFNCAFAPPFPAAPALVESAWTAVDNAGHHHRFTLAPQVSAAFALDFALTHPSLFDFARIMRVEEVPR